MRVVYLRLLDANAANADWREVARVVLNIDPDSDPLQARRTWDSHLRRAVWMAEYGFQFFLQ
ncbi:MAG TPA: hypothetical protein VGV14_14725 [Rhodanobacter sp.]|nr:hypothetical protein [Rhodanobacter sp.]